MHERSDRLLGNLTRLDEGIYWPPPMELALEQLVMRIHASGCRAVLAITGGGSGVIAALLTVPGASRFLLEAVVPYDSTALVRFLGHEPAQACSAETAVAMARRALGHAERLAPRDATCIGLGLTASLVSDRPKRGDHRCHVAVTDGGTVDIVSIVLEKERRDRAAEESLVANSALLLLARACGVPAPDQESLLGPGDRLAKTTLPPADPVGRLLAGTLERVTVAPDGQCVTDAPAPRGVLPGSFNPLHEGHVELARVAHERLGAPVAFELSVVNVDKPPLGAREVRRRMEQLAWRATLELSRAPTFREKARLFPGAVFVVGADTAVRIVDPRYYGGSEAGARAALDEVARRGCRFLVAGRADPSGRFVTLDDVRVPYGFEQLFEDIPATRFRRDISSTGLRG